MAEVFQNQPDTVTIVLSDSSDGSPLTGVVAADITMFIRKDGRSPAQKTVDEFNFRELDATNMPGLYEIDFTGADLDTAGEFIAVIKGTAAFDQVSINLTVKPSDTQAGKDSLQVIADQEATLYVQMTRKGVPITPTDDLTLTEPLPFNFINVRVQTKSGGSAAHSIFQDWYEMDRVNLPGYYKLELDSTLISTANLGDLTVDLKPTDSPFWDEYDTSATSLRGIYFEDKGTGWVAGGTEINQSTDGGLTWSVDGHSSSVTETLNALDGVYDSGGDVHHLYTAGASNTVHKYNGTSWSTASVNTAGGVDNVKSISAATPTNIFFLGKATGSTSGGYVSEYDGTSTFSTHKDTTVGGTYEAIHAVSATEFWVVGGKASAVSDAVMFKYDTSGSSTTFRGQSLDGSTDSFRDVHFYDATHGIAVADNGQIFYTTDGDTFTKVDVGSADFISVHMISQTEAYASGGNNYYTEDGGATWTQVQEPWTSGASFYGIDSIEDQVWLALGSSVGKSRENHFDRKTLNLQVVEDVKGDVVAEIGGVGFNPDRDTLHNLRSLQDLLHDKWESSVAPVTKGTAPSFAVQFINDKGDSVLSVSGVDYFDSSFIKDGEVSSSGLENWTEIDPVNLPGFYKFTLPATLTANTGDLALRLGPRSHNWKSTQVDMAELDVYPDLYDIETIDNGTIKYAMTVGYGGQNFAEDGEVYISTDFKTWTRDTPSELANYGFYPETNGCDLKVIDGDVVRAFTGEEGHLFVDQGDGVWHDVSLSSSSLMMQDVIIIAKDNIWACGYNSGIMHFDGSTDGSGNLLPATLISSPVSEFFQGLAYSANSKDLHIGGTNGTILEVANADVNTNTTVTDVSSIYSGTGHVNDVTYSGVYFYLATDDGIWRKYYGSTNFSQVILPDVTTDTGSTVTGTTHNWDFINADLTANGHVVAVNESDGIIIRYNSDNEWVQDTIPDEGGRTIWAVSKHGLATGNWGNGIDVFQYGVTIDFYNRVLRFQIVEPSRGSSGWQ